MVDYLLVLCVYVEVAPRFEHDGLARRLVDREGSVVCFDTGSSSRFLMAAVVEIDFATAAAAISCGL